MVGAPPALPRSFGRTLLFSFSGSTWTKGCTLAVGFLTLRPSSPLSNTDDSLGQPSSLSRLDLRFSPVSVRAFFDRFVSSPSPFLFLLPPDLLLLANGTSSSSSSSFFSAIMCLFANWRSAAVTVTSLRLFRRMLERSRLLADPSEEDLRLPLLDAGPGRVDLGGAP